MYICIYIIYILYIYLLYIYIIYMYIYIYTYIYIYIYILGIYASFLLLVLSYPKLFPATTFRIDKPKRI